MTFGCLRAASRALIVVLVAVAVAAPAFAVTKTWTNNNGSGDGKWSTASNWSPSGVPTSSDDVEIGVTDMASNYLTIDSAAAAAKSLTVGNSFTNNPTVEIKNGQTLTIDSASSVDAGANILLNYGNIAGNGALTINGNLNVNGGQISGPGTMTIASSGVINFNATSNYTYLSRDTTNNGTINFNSGAVYDFYFYNSAILTNNGVVDVKTDENIWIGGTGTQRIDNQSGGIVRKSGGTGTTVLKMAVNNASGGFVKAVTGTLTLEAGGASQGDFDAASGKVIAISGTSYTFNSGATVSGLGKIELSHTLVINTGADVTIPNLHLLNSSAKVDGSGILRIATLLQWDGGTMAGSGGTTIVTSSATMNMACSTYHCSFDARQVNVAIGATANYTPTSNSAYFYNSASLSFNSTSTFNILTDQDFNYGGGTLSSITNSGGTVQKTSGSGATAFNVPFSSSGAISVTAGDLQFASGATITGGSINVGTTSNFDVTGGTFNVSSAATVTGTGAFRVTGGILRVPTGVTQVIPKFTLAGSSMVDGGGTLQLTGTSTWTGGTMGTASATGGTTEVMSGATLNITATANYAYLDYTRQLLNNGTIVYNPAPYALYLYGGADIVNNGTFEAQTDAAINISGSGSVFTNNSQFLKTGGTGASGMSLYCQFDNAATGLVNVSSGRLNLAGKGTSSGIFNISVAGAYIQITADYEFAGTPTVTGAGTLRVVSNNLIVGSGVTVSVPNFVMDGGYVSGAGTLRLSGTADWNAGTMGHPSYPGGTTEVMLSSALNINSTTYVYLDSARTLVNGNVINYTSATYGLWLYNGSSLVNNGTFNYNTDVGIGVSGSGNLITNNNLIYRTSGSGTAALNVPLDNLGTIQADSGTLLLGGNGTHTGGLFTGNGSGAVGFSAGTHNLNAASALSGTGTIMVTGGTVNVAGTYNPTKLLVSGGILNFNSNGTAGIVTLTNTGTIGGSGTLTIQDDSTWTGGTMNGSGTTIMSASKTLTITATTSYCYLDTRTLTNNGTIQYPATAANYYFYLYNNGTLSNAGTFEITADQVVYGASNGFINNNGTFTKTAGTGDTFVSATFNNSGNVSATSGTLSFANNGTNSGNFTATAPATIAFTNGTVTFAGAGTLGGTGTLAFTGATATVNATVSVGTLKITNGLATLNAASSADTLDLSNGTLGGSATLTLNNGGTWAGGTMAGSGNTIIPSGKTLTISCSVTYATIDGRTVTNNGTINYTPASFGYLGLYNGGTLNNNATFNHQTNQTIYGPAGTFNNAGSFNRSSGTGSSTVSAPFNNTGSVSVTTGTLAFSSNGTHTGTWTVTSPAELHFSGGTQTATAGSITGTGTLAFTGVAATFGIPYTVGALSVTNGTATMNGTGSADAFTMSGGTLGGSGTLTLNNGGTWSGGTMTGSGGTIIPTLKSFTITAASTYCTLDTRILTNNGNITYSPSGGAYLQISNNAVLNNAGTFTATAGVTVYGSGNGSFNNTGSFTKTGTSALDWYPVFNNFNQLTVSGGTLNLIGGGTHTNGVFTATSPGTIQFGNGTHTLSGSGSMGGTGTYSVTGGTITVGVPYAMAALTMSNGTVDFNTNGTVGSLNMTYGIIGGTGTVTFTENGTWAGGIMNGTGTSIFSSGKTYTFGGSNYLTVDTRTLTNNGTINYVAPTYYLQIYNNGTLNNAGTFSVQTDLYIYGASGGTINNTGTFERTTGSGNTTQVGPVFNNNGTVNVTTGALEFVGGGAHNGAFNVTTPAVLNIANGTNTFNAPSTLAGTGRYRFLNGTSTVNGTWSGILVDLNGGTLSLNTDGNLTALDMAGSGTLDGTGNVTVTGNSNWNGGTLQGTGTITVDTGVTITMPGTTYYTTLARPLMNDGTINYSAPIYYLQLNGATLTNAGTFDVQANTSLLYAYGASPSFVNNGTLKKTAAGTTQFNAPLSNAGTVQVAAGTLYFTTTYTQSAGTTELLNNATLQVTTLDINGGSLIGNGTVQGSVTSDGIVAPGASAGTLTITGNYSQSASGVMNVELGGTTAGTGYDQLVVQGSATLAGDLNVSLINSFFPASGNTFQILTFASRTGDFANKNGLSLGSGTNLIPAYSATDLQLTTNTVQTDLGISMNATPATVNNGSAFSWNIAVTNGGGSNASGVQVTATVPANATFVSASPAICTGAPNLVCTIGTLPNGGNANLTITANANGSGTASMTANVSGSQFDPNGTNNSAAAGPAISGNADLGVSVADSPDPVAAGSLVTYTITVTNNGFDSASGVTLGVTVPSELTFNSASAPCSGGFPCSLGTLGNGATSVITSTWTVSPTATGTTQLTASVSASAPTDPVSGNNSANASTTVAQDADVQVVKTGPSNVPPEAGSTVTYNIAVTNNGPSIATAVNLDDPTPSGLTPVSVSGDCTAFPCAIGTMTVGQTKNIQAVYQINGAIGTTYINTATITSGADTNNANDSSSVTTTVSNCPATSITAPASVNGGSTGNAASVTSIAGASYSWSIGNGTITSGASTSAITFTAGPSGAVTLNVTVTSGACTSNPSAVVPIVSADLAVIKTGPANVSPLTASSITYNISVTNNGPSSAASVTLTDTPQAGLSFVSATGACTAFPCALGTLTSGQSVTAQATYSFSSGLQGQSVTNTASASSSTPDPGSANNSSTATTVIASCPSISITGPTAIEPNASGNATVTTVTGATYNWTITNGTIDSGNGTTAIAFTAGSSGTTTLNVNVVAGQCNLNATLPMAVTSTQADVAISKSAPSSVASGASFDYTITVTNNGPATADAVTVTDSLPSGVSLAAASPQCGGSTVITCTLGTMAAGATQVLTITVDAPVGPASITNTADVSTTTVDPTPINDSSSASTSVAAAPSTCPTSAPVLTAPANGDPAVVSPVAFDWNPVANATSYELWLGATSASLVLVDTTSSTSSTLDLSSGEYAWQVIALGNNTCNGVPSAVHTFTIPVIDSCGDHASPSLVSPLGGTSGANVTFSWNGVGGAIGYVVNISVNGGAFQQAGSTAANVTSLTTTVPAGTINWVVDALFANCPATHSDEGTFTVEAAANCQAAAAPTAPADGTSTSEASVDFAWTGVAGSTGYRVWLQTGTNAPEVIGSTLDTSVTNTIPVGTHSWWVETLYPGCPSRESAHLTLTILPAQNCDGRGRPTLLGPAGGSSTSNAEVAFSWTAVTNAIEYELWLALNGGVPTLVGTTTTTSLTIEVAPGELEWFVRALFNGCQPTASDSSTFSYTPPANCASNIRPVLIAPAEGEKLASPVLFDWNDVAGATGYDLVVDDQVAASTTASQATVTLPLGAGRWQVRAKFAQGCSALDSTDSQFVIVPQQAACSPLDAPVLAAPGQISAGVNARLQWSFVAGATAYVLESADNPDFTGAEVSDTGNGRQEILALDNAGSEPLARYFRVRAVDTRCNPPLSGPWSDTAVLYVLPEVGTEASTPIGEDTDVEYTINLGPELAGQSFTATPTASWISVTPASGVVAAGGTNLTVTAHTAGLPPGTNIGGVSISTGSASRVSAQGVTTVTTPVSVSLVSPVTSTPKSTPPPDALVIPAVANADGIGSHFQSDVRVSNTSAQVMKYQLSYIPTGDAGISAGRQTTFSIEPGRTVALDDILKTWFGTGPSNAIGTLEVRPLTEVAKSTSSAALGALANIVTFASSRTFNVTPNGTFGQYIPAIPFANFIGKSADVFKPTVLSLQQISQSARYRTNLGLVEGSGQPVSLLVKVFNSAGTKLNEFPVNLAGGQHTQLNGFLAQQNITSLDDGRVEVEVVGGNGKVTAYASVLDNSTSDPLLVSPVTLTDNGNTKWVLPGVADLNTGGANWQTDMRVFNAGSTSEQLALSFYSMNGGEPKTVLMELQPGEVKQLDRILNNTFGVTQNGGAVHVTSTDAARLIATARTYNLTTQGTYGQFISAVTPAEAAAVGSRPLQLLQVEESTRYRSNIGLAEVSGKPVTLEVSIVPPDAKFTASVRVDLAANEFRQINSMLAGLGVGDIYNARVSIRAVAGEGRATAYASVIDLKTNDPTLVPAQ